MIAYAGTYNIRSLCNKRKEGFKYSCYTILNIYKIAVYVMLHLRALIHHIKICKWLYLVAKWVFTRLP